MALKRLKKLRKERFGGNQAFNDPEKKRPRKVEYILVFAGNKKNKPSIQNQYNDESYLYLDNMAKEKITQIWTKEGGSIGGNNIEPNDPIRDNPLYVLSQNHFTKFSVILNFISTFQFFNPDKQINYPFKFLF